MCLVEHDIIPLVPKPNKPPNQKMKIPTMTLTKKQPTSYLVSNRTSDKNDNMATIERNVKEYTSSVESIFEKMMAGPEGGKSM